MIAYVYVRYGNMQDSIKKKNRYTPFKYMVLVEKAENMFSLTISLFFFLFLTCIYMFTNLPITCVRMREKRKKKETAGSR